MFSHVGIKPTAWGSIYESCNAVLEETKKPLGIATPPKAAEGTRI